MKQEPNKELRKRRIQSILNRILLFALIVFLIVPVSGISSYAAECTDQPEALSVSFLNTGSTANISATCYYSDEYFYQPGTYTDSHLRTLSLAVAMSALESYREDENDYTNRCENFEKLMSSAGFFDFSHNAAFDEKPTEETIGIIIARRDINVFGTDYTLIAVGIRGASYEAEWANNMRVGASGQAEGFSSAKDQVLAYLAEYEAVRGITDHAKIWVTGFSRAGAVSNLTGQALNENPAAYATTPEDIYCYTFEAPQGEEIQSAGQYSNIHNTVFPADPVPLIPFSVWGMTRVGYTQEGQEDPYSQDDSLLPGPGSETYEQNKNILLEHLAEINPDIDYIIDDFTELSFDLFSIHSEEPPLSQSEYIQELLSWLNSTLPEQSRASYAEHYQDAFSKLARVITGAGVSKAKLIAAAYEDAVKDPAFYAGFAEAVLVIRLKDVMEEADYDTAMNDCAAMICDCLVEHMVEKGVELSEEDRQALTEALGPIIRFSDAALLDDILHHAGYHLATLFSNLSCLIQAHNPEVILAWLMTFDSYYTPAMYTPHRLEYMPFSDATCTQSGHKSHWQCTQCGVRYAKEDGQQKLSEEELLIPAKGHNWNEGIIAKEATVSSNGIRIYTCLSCGRTHTESIPKLPPPSPTPEIESPDETAAHTTEESAGSFDQGILLLFVLIAAAIIIAIGVLLYFYNKKREG